MSRFGPFRKHFFADSSGHEYRVGDLVGLADSYVELARPNAVKKVDTGSHRMWIREIKNKNWQAKQFSYVHAWNRPSHSTPECAILSVAKTANNNLSLSLDLAVPTQRSLN